MPGETQSIPTFCPCSPLQGVKKEKVSGAGGATLKERKLLNFQALFCAASYNIERGFSHSPRGSFRVFLTPPLTTPTGWMERKGGKGLRSPGSSWDILRP